MTITGTKVVNGRIVNVWKYTDEEKEEMQKKSEEHRQEMDNRFKKLKQEH